VEFSSANVDGGCVTVLVVVAFAFAVAVAMVCLLAEVHCDASAPSNYDKDEAFKHRP
jgi:hypothetical protein